MDHSLTDTFASSDQRPLPLLVAEKWNFPLQHYQRFDVEGGYLYALQDWAIGLVGEKGKQTLRDFKRYKKEVVVESSHSLPYLATDGKTYKRDFVTDKILYLFAQYARPLDEREVLAAIRNYLAEAGVLVDELRRDPETVVEGLDAEALFHAGLEKWRAQGKTDDWIDARVQGIITRKQFTEALRDAVLNVPMSLYGQATEKVYEGLWERTTAKLRDDLNLTPRQNIRDHFGKYALIYTRLAEAVATDKLGDQETVSIKVAMKIVWEAATIDPQTGARDLQSVGDRSGHGAPAASEGALKVVGAVRPAIRQGLYGVCW